MIFYKCQIGTHVLTCYLTMGQHVSKLRPSGLSRMDTAISLYMSGFKGFSFLNGIVRRTLVYVIGKSAAVLVDL